ncbi:MAG: hypothetical protein AAGC93_19430 [Cyanobacteria bacterium P01_F01_bin.53]
MTTSMKHVLSGILSFVAVLVAAGVSALTREALQAKNTLDAGAGLYSHGGTATFAGFLAFTVVLFSSVFVLRRTLSYSQKQIPLMVAVLTCTCLSPFLAVALFF